MSRNFHKNCLRCKQPGIEVIDDWEGFYCPCCADALAERDRERREWDYYHPPDDDRTVAAPVAGASDGGGE